MVASLRRAAWSPVRVSLDDPSCRAEAGLEGSVTPVHTLPTERLLDMRRGALPMLRDHIDSILKIRFLGSRITPAPCVKVGAK